MINHNAFELLNGGIDFYVNSVSPTVFSTDFVVINAHIWHLKVVAGQGTTTLSQELFGKLFQNRST